MEAHRADLCFVMPGDRASREPRAGIADAALNTILQLAPMRRRCAKLLPHEMVDPGFAKRNRVLFSGHAFHDIGDLPARSRQIDPFHAHANLQLFIH